MMIKKLLSGLLLFAAISSYAQTQYLGKSDPDAKKILDDVSAKFKTYKSVSAHFTLKIENSSEKLMGAKDGTISMKDSKYQDKCFRAGNL